MHKSDFDLDYQNQNIESKIIAAFERIAQAFRVLLWQESKVSGLSPIQIQILIFIRHHDAEKCKVSYLANEFNMTKATISDASKVLEEKELISKVVEKNDIRSYVIKLTNKGKTITNRTALFTTEIRNPIDKLSTNDKTGLLLNLLDIIKHLNQTGVITVQRMCLTCSHHQNTKKQTHFCKLLNQQLLVNDLRVDCPEHQLQTV